jgi:hypothetical protein
VKARWTRHTAIIALRLEAARIGRTPGDKDLRKPGRVCASLKTYRRLFGTLGAAQRAAGLRQRAPGGFKGWRKRFCKRGHRRIPEFLDRQGHCRLCAAFWRHRRGKGPMLPRGQTKPLVYETRVGPRVVRAETALRHSPEAMARYWRLAA